MDPAATVLVVTEVFGIKYDAETDTLTLQQESQTVAFQPRETPAPASTRRRTPATG